MPQPEKISAGRPFARLPGLAGLHRALDQLERGRPVEAHAALGGVHGLGHAEAQVPQVLAVAQRRVPVDRAVEPGIVGGARVGHHVRGREGDAVEGALGLVGIGARLGQHEGLEPAGVGRQVDLEGGEDGCVHRPCPCPQCERLTVRPTRLQGPRGRVGLCPRIHKGSAVSCLAGARWGCRLPGRSLRVRAVLFAELSRRERVMKSLWRRRTT